MLASESYNNNNYGTYSSYSLIEQYLREINLLFLLKKQIRKIDSVVIIIIAFECWHVHNVNMRLYAVRLLSANRPKNKILILKETNSAKIPHNYIKTSFCVKKLSQISTFRLNRMTLPTTNDVEMFENEGNKCYNKQQTKIWQKKN